MTIKWFQREKMCNKVSSKICFALNGTLEEFGIVKGQSILSVILWVFCWYYYYHGLLSIKRSERNHGKGKVSSKREQA